MTYDIGDRPRVTATFTDLAGTVVDPTIITCALKYPNGTTTVTYTFGVDGDLQRTSIGIYTLDFTITQAGGYGYKFNGLGAIVASVQGRIAVRRSVA
jgi:hypothetical protein